MRVRKGEGLLVRRFACEEVLRGSIAFNRHTISFGPGNPAEKLVLFDATTDILKSSSF